MTHEQLSKLKDGDIICNRDGNAYTVLRNTGSVVIAARTLEVFNGAEWEHVYTTIPVKEQAPQISLVHMVTELQALGWTFYEDKNEWRSPDGDITVTYTARDCDSVILNLGTLEDFHLSIWKWAEEHQLLSGIHLGGQCT